MRRVSGALVVVALLALVCVGATETLRNDSGRTANGVTITFSEKVRITSYDTAVFPNQEPAGRSDSFTFSGGELAKFGRFQLSWTPSSGSIASFEWQAPLARSRTPTGIAEILGSYGLGDLPVLQEWNDPSQLTYGEVDLATGQWTSSDSRYARLDDRDWQISCLKGGLLETGIVFRVEFSPEGHPSAEPAVEYQISMDSACVLLSPGSGISGRLYGVDFDVDLPWDCYMVDAGSMTIAVPRSYLAAEGLEPDMLLGKPVRLAVKYREPTTHYFLEYGKPGQLARVMTAEEVEAEARARAAAEVEAAAIPGLEYLGNPFAERLPDGSGWEAARRVWDMQTFGDRIYLAHGNQRGNSGPTPVWYWDSTTEAFVNDFTVDDEQISAFEVVGKEMLVAGADSTGSSGFGNVYIFDGLTWTKRDTLPSAVHVRSAWRFDGALFASIFNGGAYQVLRSDNDGLTWDAVFSDSDNWPTLFEFNGHLYASGAWGNVAFLWDGQAFSRIEGQVLFVEWVASIDPTLGFAVVRSEEFGGALVYIGEVGCWHSSVYVMRQMSVDGIEKLSIGGPFQVGVGGDQWITHAVQGEAPQDVVVEDEACWVLTNEMHTDDIAATVRVYTSNDLATWTKLLEFESPAVADSFEVHGGYIYFGLGPAHPYTYYDNSTGENYPTAGRVYRYALPETIMGPITGVVPVEILGLEYLGNPFAGRLLDGSGWEAARSVWDMQTFGDRIYLAHGSQQGDSGPTPVWYWDCPSEMFVQEFTVDDEEIRDFRVVGTEMLVAGADATESWDFGNIYIFDGSEWTKLRTLANAIHVVSVWRFDGSLFATIRTEEGPRRVLRSDDGGLTWTVLGIAYADEETYALTQLFEFAGRLYLSNAEGSRVLAYDGQAFSEVEGLSLFPGSPINEDIGPGYGMGRFEPFGTDRAYVGRTGPNIHSSMYVMHEMSCDGIKRLPIGRTISWSDEGTVQSEGPYDVVVEDGACWALTNEMHVDDIASTVRVYRSEDLTSWTKVLEFESPTVAASFEVHGGYVYLGLGTAHPHTYNEHSLGQNHPAAGRVYRYALP